MKRHLLPALILLCLFAGSCSSDKEDELLEISEDNFDFNEDQDELENFIRIGDAGVVGFTYVDPSNGDLVSSDQANQVSNIAIEQIATLAPPSINGEFMRTSHIDINGNYAYISYTKEGEQYLGGIDIIDISNPSKPKLTSRLTTATADINALYYLNDKVYFAAAVDVDKDASSPFSARIGSIAVANGYFDSKVNLAPLSGPVAIDVIGFNSSVIGLGGGTSGAVALFNAGNLRKTLEKPISDLRAAAYRNGNLVVLTGGNGIYQLDPTSLDVLKNFPTSKLTPESKRTIALYKNMVIVSEGAQGAGLYDLHTGAFINRIPINSISGNSDSQDADRVTNAVSIENGLLYMANGAAGFALAKLNPDNSISQEGIVEIDGSTNHVRTKGTLVLVASGRSGLQILRISNTLIDPSSYDSCDQLEEYRGDPVLIINQNTTQGYSGTATLQQLSINGHFTYCGTLNVQKNIKINNDAVFNLSGALAAGAIGKGTKVSIGTNATLKVNGSITIYGDLILSNYATLEFIGDNSSINIYGSVIKGSNVKILGNYRDLSNKL